MSERAADADHRGDALVRLFLWWRFAKAVSFRGYWLVTAVYLVVVADLSPFEPVFLGTAMEITVFVCEIPTASDVRATVQSFLGQTESLGEISGGLVMAVLAQSASITVALTASAALITLAALTIARSPAGGATDHRAAPAVGGIA